MSKPFPRIAFDLLISLASALVLSGALAFFQAGIYLTSFLAAAVILWAGSFLCLLVWRFFKGGRTLAAIMLVTFFLRVTLGVYLQQSLPVIGFDTDVQNAGYVYSDAYTRDQQAYNIACTPGSLYTAVRAAGHTDQYGGLLFLSTLVYRLLSPDVARPLLITLLAALAMTLGAAFLYDAAKNRWGERVAVFSAWFLALYPEGVLLGSSQMREPFLIAFLCLGIWALFTWQDHKLSRSIVLILAMASAVLFSIPVGLLFTVCLLVLALVGWLSAQTMLKPRLLGWAALAVIALVSAYAGWKWLQPTLYYDAWLTQSSSGLIAMLLKGLGKQWTIPFVTAYGLAQPVLPAALTDVSLPIWMGLSIWRGLGWYIAIPFLLYGALALWRARPVKDKWQMLFVLIALVLWTVVSSARAGGDQWDNPRYRAVFLPLLALLAAWLAVHAQQKHSPWLMRIFVVVFVDVLLFTLWYLPRRGAWGLAMSFVSIVTVVGVFTLLFTAGCILYDRFRRKTKTAQ